METLTLGPLSGTGRRRRSGGDPSVGVRLAGTPAGRHHRPVSTTDFVGDPLAVLQAALAGRYRLERLVGQGGMGVVYLAQDLKHDREVAIKVLRPGVAALLGRERFLREIGIAAQLSHPHIVPLHDSGEADGHLYYVMPYVTGETLRERLDREGRLAVDEALRITGQVAAALVHAHGRGVVHRDIKPSNILLSGGFALVADFGLARALSRVEEGVDISSVGLPIGTPRYMSPEQAVGSPSVDGRSDLYSLGCVLHEMLLGFTPRDSITPGGEVTPVRLSALRQQLPPSIERTLLQCLAANPADRFATAQDLVTGLGAPVVPIQGSRLFKLAVAVVLLGVIAWTLSRVTSGAGLRGTGTTLDTSRYAILPFERLPGAPAFQADLPLRAALGHWGGITVVSGVQVSEAVKSAGSAALDRVGASRIAQQLGAGRFIRGQVVPFGDSVQVEAVVYETRNRVALVEKSVRIPRDLAGVDSIIPRLADSLLFRGAMPVEHFAAPPGTTSIRAMWAFIRGRDAVGEWDLAAADSGFGQALAADPGFARAALWLAQVRAWEGQPSVTWRSPASQAAAGALRLGSRDSALAGVIAGMARGEYGPACPRALALTRQWPGEFPVWYDAATCLSRDGAVMRDPRSPTGWRFRSSYHQVQRAWRQAFALNPSIYRDFLGGSLRSSQWLLWTATNRVRMGSAISPDTGFFASYPIWQGDTLTFLPRPLADITQARAARPGATREAVTRQRLTFFELATEWASTDPRSLEAREAIALALWSLGNSSAIDSMKATRGVARSPRDRARLGVSEALMRILQGAKDSAQVAEARRIADSVLALDVGAPGMDPWDLATAAALTGRANLAARLIRRASPQTAWNRPALTRDGLAFLAFAALGGPEDSLTVLESRVSDGIATAVDADEQTGVRREWLGRAVSLVGLDVASRSLSQLAGNGDYLIDARAAYSKGDTASAMRLLRQAEASRIGSESSDLDFEAILPEARLLAAMGHTAAAINRLDPTLSDLRHLSIQVVIDPVGAALLVHAMAFRAELAVAVRDSATARRWTRTVATLWSAADPFLTPVVQRARGPDHQNNH